MKPNPTDGFHIPQHLELFGTRLEKQSSPKKFLQRVCSRPCEPLNWSLSVAGLAPPPISRRCWSYAAGLAATYTS